MNQRAWAFGAAVTVLGLNFALERALMNTGLEGRILIPGLANFTPTLNHGVSFGLFTQSTDSGSLVLMGALAVISAFVSVMAWRATATLSAIAFGLILGGALGNLADRWAYGGAVFDFLWLHLGSISLFICNGADIAITAGAVLLLAESMFAKTKPA